MKMKANAELVAEVAAIRDLVLVRSDPPALYVRAAGRVGTTGRAHAVLVPQVHAVPPADGLQEFDFLADPPRDAVLELEAEVTGECLLHDLADWAAGIRIRAAGNCLEHVFPDMSRPVAEEMAVTALVARPMAAMPPHMHAAAQSLLVESFEGFAIDAGPGRERCIDMLLASAAFPEAESRPAMRSVVSDPVSGRCILSAEMPVLYRRMVRRRLLARVHCGPDPEIREAVRKGIEGAVRAGTALGVLTGADIAMGAAALQARLHAGLAIGFGREFPEIAVELRRESMPGPWKRI